MEAVFLEQIKRLWERAMVYAKRWSKLVAVPIKKWWELAKNPKKRWLAIAIVSVILVISFVGVRALSLRAVQASNTSSTQRTATVVKGTMEITLSGSGAVSSDARAELTTEVGGKLIENYLEEGKAVKAGDVLLVLESKDAELALKKMENTVLQKEQTYLEQHNQVSSLNLKAPFSGKVTGISYEAGDNINSGVTLLTISDDSSLLARVQFANTSSVSLKGANSIQLHIPEFSSTLPANIKETRQIGDDLEVTLLIQNPGALKAGVNVWAEISTSDGVLTSEQVALEAIKEEIIKAQSSGTIEKSYINEDQKVLAGELLLTIINDGLPMELENARLQWEEAKYDLEQAQLDFDKYKIVAPFDGNIISVKDIAQGDIVKVGTNVAVLIDTNQFSFTVNIDELDVSQVKKGQEVNVTVEALEDTAANPLKGVVSSVAMEGTSNNGVTSYPISISIMSSEGLRPGMNVDGVIQVEKKENALMVPLEAVQKRGANYTVWVKREGLSAASTSNSTASPEASARGQRSKTSGQGNTTQTTKNQGTTANRNIVGSNSYYKGAMQVKVTVGIHNESYIEILEGLNEGDIVVLPQITASAASTQNSQNQRSGFNNPTKGVVGIPSIGGGGNTPRSGGQ